MAKTGRPVTKAGYRRRTFYLPDDVAEYLKSTGNASAEIERIVRDEMNKDSEIIVLVNPFSLVDAREMTWGEIKKWCADHVHPDNRRDWMREAEYAFRKRDGLTLGTMIIGS